MSHVFTLTPAAPGRWRLRCCVSQAEAVVEAEANETDLAEALMAVSAPLRYGLLWPAVRKLAREALEER